jgi:peptide/nickel transport system substrate-binding protein
MLAPIVASVNVVDPQHVAFNLVAPSPVLFSLLGERAGFMVSPAAWQQRGSAFGSQPIGTGAFVLKEWMRGSRVVLERNPTYWQPGLPYLDRIVVQDLAGSVIGVQRLLTGEIDYVDQLTPADILPIENRAGIVLKTIKVGRWYFLQWHVNEQPFDNPKLRQAFAHAIDRNRLNEITMRGQGTVSNGPTPEGLWWYDPVSIPTTLAELDGELSIEEFTVSPKPDCVMVTGAAALLTVDVLNETPGPVVVAKPVPMLVIALVRKVDVHPPRAPTAESVVGAWFAEHGLLEPAYAPSRPVELLSTNALFTLWLTKEDVAVSAPIVDVALMRPG